MSNVRKNVLAFLAELSNKEFAEFFYEAVRGRLTSDAKEWQGHFILADSEQVSEDEPWDVDVIALHDPQHYPASDWGDDAPICQSGTCSLCGHKVRSWAKQAICPICGEIAYCT